jgi:hypothetical protein
MSENENVNVEVEKAEYFKDILIDYSISLSVVPVNRSVLIKAIQKGFKTINLLSALSKGLTFTPTYMEVMGVGSNVDIVEDSKELIGKRIILDSYLFEPIPTPNGLTNQLMNKAIPSDLNPHNFTKFAERVRKLPNPDYNLFLKLYPEVDIIAYFIINAVDIIAIEG